MDKSMIREAANKIRECVDFSWHNIGNSAKLEEARKLLDTILAELDKPGEGDPDAHLSDEDYLKAKQERFAKGGLANVDPDKYMEEVRGTGMVLTDGEIERIAQERVGPLADTESGRLIANTCREFYRDALRYARDNGYLSAPAKAPAEVAPSPQAVTVEGMSPVWSPAQDEFDTPCWVTGCKCAIGPICKPDLYCARCGTPIDHSRVDVDRAPASTNT